jgi:Asp-tRNA(Asn)/Glu-tRNA(Gln) amidotransferase A subunit family amidase
VKTNCITEVITSDAESWAKECDLNGPLAGVPVSLKDSCAVTGYDSTIGFSGNAFKPLTRDGPLVRLLKDAGAIPFVKTAIPITLMCEKILPC